MQQYGAKRLQGLGYLRRFGCLPEGVLAAGQTGSSLVFLFGVIGVDAGKAANHPSIQVSKYPGAEFDPKGQKSFIKGKIVVVVRRTGFSEGQPWELRDAK